MPSIVQLATRLLYGVPLLIVWAVMIVLALTRWQSHPRASKLVLSAAVLALGAFLLSNALTLLLPTLMSRAELGTAGLGLLYGVIGLVHATVTAAACGLLVYAAYRGEGEDEPPAP